MESSSGALYLCSADPQSSDEEKMLLYELKKLGPNLNQIAYQANAERFHSVAAKAEKIVDDIVDYVLKLKNRMKT